MLKKLLWCLVGLSTSWLLSGCQAEPLYSAQSKEDLPKVKLGKVSCDALQEACFWFEQHWQGEPSNYSGLEEPITLDVTLKQHRSPILYQEKTDAVRYQYKLTGTFVAQGGKLKAPWHETIEIYSYYNTLNSPFVRDMVQHNSLENIIKELQMRWWDRWRLRWL